MFICESVRDSWILPVGRPGGDAAVEGVGDPEGLAAEISGTEDWSWLVPEEAVRSLGDDGGVPSYTSLDLRGVIVAGDAEKEQLPGVRLPRSECDIDLLLLEDKELIQLQINIYNRIQQALPQQQPDPTAAQTA